MQICKEQTFRNCDDTFDVVIRKTGFMLDVFASQIYWDEKEGKWVNTEADEEVM